MFYFFLFSTNSVTQLNEIAGHAGFVSLSALPSVSARWPVCWLVGSWTRSQVLSGLSGTSDDKSAGIHQMPDWKLRNRPLQGNGNRCSPHQFVLFSRFSISSRVPTLDPCIIVVTPVPSRDTQGRVNHQCLPRTLCCGSPAIVWKMIARWFCCHVRFKKRDEWHSCSSEICVPFSFEQQCDQHYVILQANRYLIKRCDVEGYCREGCADEAWKKKEKCFNHLITPLSLCFCDNTINKHHLSCTLPKINM